MPEQVRLSPGRLVWQRFRESRSARWALWALGAMFALALYAPFLCSDVALLWWDAEGLRLPQLVEVFNRKAFPLRHDLLFSIAAVLLPFLLLGAWLLRRRWSVPRRWLMALAAIFGCWGLCQVPLLPTANGWTALWDDRSERTESWSRWHALPADQQPWTCFAVVPHRHDRTHAGATLLPPGSINPHSDARFWLGSDSVGRDLLARMLYGARIALTIGLVATGIAMFIGVLIGSVSGYFGGWVDLLLMRLTEIMMSFPTLILLLVVLAVFGRDIFTIMIVIGLTGWAGTARLVRGEYLAQSVRDYVLAAQALGLPRWRIMFKHILPNTAAPLLVSATFGIAGAVFTESALAFIGLCDNDAASWGVMLNEGRELIRYSWLIYVPGLSVFVLLTVLNIIGNHLRSALDTKAIR